MNEAQIHLALNHAPLFLAIAGALILIAGMIRKNESVRGLSLYFLAAAAVFTVPVYLTGEGTEEIVEHLPGVTEAAIEAHEDMAKIALLIISVTGFIALAGFFLRKKEQLNSLLYGILLIFSVAAFGTIAATAHLGGKIRHTELSAAPNAATENQGEQGKEEEEQEGRSGAMVPGSAKTVNDSIPVNDAGPAGKKDKDDDD